MRGRADGWETGGALRKPTALARETNPAVIILVMTAAFFSVRWRSVWLAMGSLVAAVAAASKADWWSR
eukprot:12886487-Prorocentrum_lima.AAC.1